MDSTPLAACSDARGRTYGRLWIRGNICPRSFAEYPELEDEDIRQALAYAAANLDDKVVELHEVP